MTALSLRRNRTKIWIGATISLVAAAATIHKIQWGSFVASIENVQLGWVFLGVCLLFLNLIVRAKRWQILLRPFGHFPWMGDCFRYYMIGYMANMLFPFKAGELIRPYLMGRKHGLSKTLLFATVLIERLTDIICLSAFLVIMLYVGSTQVPISVKKGALLMTGTTTLVLVGLWIASRYPQLIELPRPVLSLLLGNTGDRLVDYAQRILKGIRDLISTRLLVPVLATSLGMWCLALLTLTCYLRAFELYLPWYAPIFIVVITNFGMLLPSSPGAVGLAHFLYVFALSRFMVDKDIALAYAVAAHAVGFLIVVVTGLCCLWHEGLSLGQLRESGVPVQDTMPRSDSDTSAGGTA